MTFPHALLYRAKASHFRGRRLSLVMAMRTATRYVVLRPCSVSCSRTESCSYSSSLSIDLHDNLSISRISSLNNIVCPREIFKDLNPIHAFSGIEI